MRTRLLPCSPRGGEHNKDLDVEKFATDAADVSPLVDYHKHTDAVFSAECNNFYRIVVLWRRVSYKDKYGWAYDEP